MKKDDIELPPMPDIPGYRANLFDPEVTAVEVNTAEDLIKAYAMVAIELYQRRIEELEAQLEAIGAGGVSGQRITSPSRGEPWMPVESCPGGNGVRYLFVRDCGQGTLPAVEMGYMLDADTEVYMDSTHEPFTKYGYRVTHWTHLPGLPNTPQPAEPVDKSANLQGNQVDKPAKTQGQTEEPVKVLNDEELLYAIIKYADARATITENRMAGIAEIDRERDRIAHDDCAQAYADMTALLARYGQPVEPEGWQLVPKVPTEEMLAATSWPNCAGTDYKHMLEAAPKFGEEE